MIGRRLGPFDVTAKLGEGGMGEVYRATDSKLKREVALKVLPVGVTTDQERLARFEREAQLLAQLHHPNIASLHGLEESDGVRALVMELVEGEDLAARIARGPLPSEEAISIARQIAAALEEAHEKGIVHRDLKPANVKVTGDGQVKVLDFGLAKALDPASGASAGGRGEPLRSPTLMNSPTLTAAATQIGVILGTAAYMSPEQARGGAVDKRADIWAFGVVWFEMLAGRQLFAGETVSDTLAAVLRAEVDWSLLPASTPATVIALLRRCLERQPKQRLRDIGEVRIALDAPDLAADAPPSKLVEPTGGRGLRLAAVAVAGAVLALLTGVTTWLAARSGMRPEAPARAIRAVLPLPAGVSIELDGERAGMPALSHDGRRLAFGARSGFGPMQIWVLELATGNARPLPGTEDGSRPFWSPDDRRIGFFTWSHLATTPSDGGAISRLARARDARGGSWSTNGTILFAPHQYGPLLAVAAGGGEARQATRLDGRLREGTHRFPHFLPDGERFVYLERRVSFGPGRDSAVLISRLGSSEAPARLLEGGTNAVVASRHLLFVRDGSLMAQPFDLEAGRLVGQASPVVGDILFNRRFSYGVFSASDGEALAFLTGRQSDRSQLVWRDRAGKRLGEVGAAGILSGLGGLAVSPDGRRVAAARIEEGTSESDIWIFDLERGTETRLVRPEVDDFDPIFTPDSKAVLFGSKGSTQQPALIVRRDLASAAETEIAREPERYLLPMAVTPAGDDVLFGLADAENLGVYDLMVRSLSGRGESRVAVGSGSDDIGGQLSADGRWLAWASDESGRYEVYVAPFPGPGARVQVSRSGGVQPRWNPRGGELFFKAPDNNLTAVPIDLSSGTFSVGAPKTLFQVVEFLGWTYAVAPDGERFLVREPIAERDASPITILTDWTSLLAGR